MRHDIGHALAPYGRDANCLDLGGGTGDLARTAQATAGRWAVLDLSHEMLQAGHPGPRIRGDAERLPFANRSFDVVAERSVLPYTDPLAMLGEARRVVRPGGILILAEKVLGGFCHGRAERWFRDVQRLRYPQKNDLLTTTDVETLAAKAGFTVLPGAEYRRTYTQDLADWAARGGLVAPPERPRINWFAVHPPEEARVLGVHCDGRRITLPMWFTVVRARA